MNKNIFITAFLFSCLNGFAQSWPSPGTEWYYSQFTFNLPEIIVPVILSAEKDTVIAGMNCTKVVGDCQCAMPSPYYLYSINDSVFYFNPFSGSFNLLYDFSPQIGDTISITLFTGDTMKMRVDSIKNIPVNAFIRQQFFWTNTNFDENVYEFGQYYIEGIGSNYCLFPAYGVCDPSTGPLRCYYDSIVGLYETGAADSCDEIVLWWGIDEFVNQLIQVYPNPATDQIKIFIEHQVNPLKRILLYDLNGYVLYENVFDQNPTTITLDRSVIASGVYFLKLETTSPEIFRKKIYIQ